MVLSSFCDYYIDDSLYVTRIYLFFGEFSEFVSLNLKTIIYINKRKIYFYCLIRRKVCFRKTKEKVLYHVSDSLQVGCQTRAITPCREKNWSLSVTLCLTEKPQRQNRTRLARTRPACDSPCLPPTRSRIRRIPMVSVVSNLYQNTGEWHKNCRSCLYSVIRFEFLPLFDKEEKFKFNRDLLNFVLVFCCLSVCYWKEIDNKYSDL